LKNPQYSFGPFVLADSGRILRRSGEIVPVAPKALAILHVLVVAGGRVVTKQELLQAVWPDSFVAEANLTQNVFVLRKLMAADFEGQSPVETIATVGYRFRAPVEVSEESAPGQLLPAAFDSAQTPILVSEPEPSSPDETVVMRPTPRLGSAVRPAVLVGVILLLAVGLIAGLTVLKHWRLARVSADLLHPRIAVVPFSNLSQSPDAAWFSGALTETLTTDLRADPNMRVLPSETVDRAVRELKLKPSTDLDHETLRRLCNDLDCDVVVTGSYLVSGGNIRLDTHVQDVATGIETANFTSTRNTNEILQLIGKTGLLIRETFRRHAGPGQEQQFLQATTSDNPEAYRLYIEGQDAMRAYDGRSAVSLLERSIALDPKFPLSHSLLSNALAVEGFVDDSVREAHVALTLSKGLPREDQLRIEAEAALSERRYTDASQTYKTLAESYPENAGFGRNVAWTLCVSGKSQEGIDFLQSRLAETGADAHDPLLYSVAADCYGLLGDWTSSLTWSRKGVDESRRRGANILYERLLTSETQALFYLHRLPLALSESQEALSIATQYGDYSGESRALNRIGQIQTEMGKFPEAQAVLEQALALEDRLGILQRKVVTLSALTDVMLKQHQNDRAASFAQQELAGAKIFNQPSFVAKANLDIAKVDLAQGKTKDGQALIRQVAAEAARLNDRQLAAEAVAAAMDTQKSQ